MLHKHEKYIRLKRKRGLILIDIETEIVADRPTDRQTEGTTKGMGRDSVSTSYKHLAASCTEKVTKNRFCVCRIVFAVF